MKKMILFLVVALVALASIANAQVKYKIKANKQYTTVKKKFPKKSAPQTNNVAGKQGTVTLTSTSANQAYGTETRRFAIADPTVNALNMRANGNDVKVSSSGIIGMPKVTYGLANGKILLRNTTANSSGTIYGSGAVGTGTTVSGVGTSEDAIGVNGKSPYAGPWLWGSRQPVYTLPLRTGNNPQQTNSNH